MDAMGKSGAIRGSAVIGQSGGPTAVINQSLVGVIEGLRDNPAVESILGARHAVMGMKNDDFLELQGLGQDLLESVALTPAAALGSSRDKPDQAYCKQIFEVFARKNVRYFFYIGGNDSSDTCRIVNDLAAQSGYELRCFHVPKTIDNDLQHNDHTPGYPSAAKFVAQAFMGDDLDNRSLAGIKVNVIMGRNAGFLTAASVMSRQHLNDGPHLIYVPEVPFTQEGFLSDVDRVYKKLGRCLIAVSEGIHAEDGTPMATKFAKEIEHDAHGNLQLSGSGALGDALGDVIKKNLGVKRVRSDTFGYLQRSFCGCYSEVDAVEARLAGRKAAELALSGAQDGSISIVRESDDPYKASFKRIELTDVAGKTRVMEPGFLAGTCDIDDSFRRYLSPLIGTLPPKGLLPGV